MPLPCPAIILHTVGSSDQPAWTDDRRSTHVAKVFDVEADLPGELALLSILTADNTRRLEHAPPTVCTDNNQLRLARACCAAQVYAHFIMQSKNMDVDNIWFVI